MRAMRTLFALCLLVVVGGVVYFSALGLMHR